MDDMLPVMGDRDATEALVRLVHGSGHRIDETNIAPFLTGLLLGILAGSIPINLLNGLTIKLGIARGAFIVSLLIGHSDTVSDDFQPRRHFGG